MAQSGTLTFLITDLVNSTRHLQAVGDEAGQHVFRAHHKQITEALTANGGQELQWLGDGVVATFASSIDAVRCAIEIQRTAGRVGGRDRLEIRIGMHAGEVPQHADGYFGAPLVIARRLCDRATSGQILCSSLIADLLSARGTIKFRDTGVLDLNGISRPIGTCEVAYDRDDSTALLNRTPFVGRTDAMKRLWAKLEEACNGRGAIATILGEAGIGKTRLVEEFIDAAHQRGVQVLRGACYDGEWQPPYGPFAEAVVAYTRQASRAEVELACGNSASTLARIVPALRKSLGEIPEPAPLDREEERLRLLDAIAQFLIAISRKQPLILVLDDLHWADRGTAMMLNHLVRFVPLSAILVIGAYREDEVDRAHPLAPLLAALRRLPNFEHIGLKGLTVGDVSELLGIIGDQAAPDAFAKAIGHETDGNPFFIRELLLHLKEEGKILRDGKGWSSKFDVIALGIPEGVRQMVSKRLARLSLDANQMLSVASAFNGTFSFSVAASVARLDETAALGAIDEGMNSQLIRAGADSETFEFTHALIRHTLYADLSPLRQTRMHRKIAEAMEAAWGERAAEHAAEVAYQFWRAGSASGTARGVRYAIAAANNAEAAYAHDEAAAFLRIAIELLPRDDVQRPRLLARLGATMIWTPSSDDAVEVVREAGRLIATAEGAAAAADYFESSTFAMWTAHRRREAWELAQEGLKFIGDRRDLTWATLREFDLMRISAEDPRNPGIRTDTPEQRELGSVLKSLPREQIARREFAVPVESRDEILRDPEATAQRLLFLAGEYRRSRSMFQRAAVDAEREGRLAWAAKAWSDVAASNVALGEFEEASAACDRASALLARAAGSAQSVIMDLMGAMHDLRIALDDGWEQALQDAATANLAFQPTPDNHWALAMIRACAAYAFARINQPEMALGFAREIPPALKRGAPWEPTYSAVACDAAAALWTLNRTDYLDVIEHSLLQKVVAPDFRWPMRDGRLSLARLAALRGDYEGALSWFGKARSVLEEQGARPLRAITDYDEGLMYLRRAWAGDNEHARPLFQSANRQFRELAMTGWMRRAQETGLLN